MRLPAARIRARNASTPSNTSLPLHKTPSQSSTTVEMPCSADPASRAVNCWIGTGCAGGVGMAAWALHMKEVCTCVVFRLCWLKRRKGCCPVRADMVAFSAAVWGVLRCQPAEHGLNYARTQRTVRVEMHAALDQDMPVATLQIELQSDRHLY